MSDLPRPIVGRNKNLERTMNRLSFGQRAPLFGYVILILLIMRVITNPLRQLTDASQRLADADYDVDLNYRGRNEIGTLTGAFKRMRDQIRLYIDDLNHQLYHDRLTDLPNMRHFFTLAEAARDEMLSKGLRPVML